MTRNIMPSLLFLALIVNRCLTEDFDPLLKTLELKIAISVWPPLVFNCSNFPTLLPSKECPFPGFDAENLGIIFAHMGVANYSYHIFDKRVTSSGDFVNGAWTDIFGMIENGTVDTICGGYQRTEIREQYFDFSYPVLQIKPVFVVKKREAGLIEAVVAVFRSFNIQVWLVIVAIFVVQVVSLYLVDYILIGHGEEKMGVWSPANMFFNMYRLFINQIDDELRHPTLTGNVLVVTFGLVDVLLVSLYQGLLLTELLHPPEVKPFSNIDEMIQRIGNKEFSLITYYPGNWYFQDLQTSEEDHFVKMRAALSKNPLVINENQTQVLEMVAAGRYILPLDTDGEVLYYAKHQYCDLTYIDEGLPSQYRHYIFKKGSPWLPLFNNASIGQQAFAINAWEKYFGSTASARDPNEIELRCPKDPPQVRALTMETLTGLFCLLIGGSIVASASFTIEYVGCLRKTIGLKLFGPVKEMRKLARAVTREKKKLLQMKDKDRFDLYRRESYYFSGF